VGLAGNNFLSYKFRETLLFDRDPTPDAGRLAHTGPLLWADVVAEVCAKPRTHAHCPLNIEQALALDAPENLGVVEPGVKPEECFPPSAQTLLLCALR
jgi:hypothetical protein